MKAKRLDTTHTYTFSSFISRSCFSFWFCASKKERRRKGKNAKRRAGKKEGRNSEQVNWVFFCAGGVVVLACFDRWVHRWVYTWMGGSRYKRGTGNYSLRLFTFFPFILLGENPFTPVPSYRSSAVWKGATFSWWKEGGIGEKGAGGACRGIQAVG